MTDEDVCRLAMDDAVRRRDEWVAARLREVAPALADVPEQTTRFLQNVQRMLAASNGYDAAVYAGEVVREARTVAALNVEHRRLAAHLMALAPLEFSVHVATMEPNR